MKAEIITVGTELLLGQTLDTNSQLISQYLNEWGVDVTFRQTVGDNKQRLQTAFKLALSRADMVVLSGGLGPTEDDLTKEIVSQVLGISLLRDSSAIEKIRLHFEQGHRKIAENNWQQADYLEGGYPLENKEGLAVGSYWEQKGKIVVLLPGPPKECQSILEGALRSQMLERFKGQKVLYSRYIHLYGIGESEVASRLRDLIHQQSDPTIALYAKPTEVCIRLSTKASSQEEADEIFKSPAQIIQKALSQFIYAEGKSTSLAKKAMKLLQEKDLSLAVAESLTGGLMMGQLTAIPGASIVLKGGVVSYASEVKRDLLGVSKSIIDAYGVVSEQCAREMANHVRKLCRADIGIALTGVAGPSQQEGKAVGTVYIAIALAENTYVLENNFSGNRERIRQHAIHKALFELLHLLQ